MTSSNRSATERGITWDYQQSKGVPVEGRRPFPGFAWRSVPELSINASLALSLHVSTRAGYEQGMVGPPGGGQEVHRTADTGEPLRREAWGKICRNESTCVCGRVPLKNFVKRETCHKFIEISE